MEPVEWGILGVIAVAVGGAVWTLLDFMNIF
jgi:hypothetical protein